MTETQATIAPVSEDTLKGWLQNRLTEERFQHSLGAQAKALELAKQFKLSRPEIEKAAIAGLTHDAAKQMTPEELFETCRYFNIELSEEDRQSVQTLHPFVGAVLLQLEFGINDDEILNAIRYHTTGRPGMSAVEKVVYLADKIEENTRNPLYIQKIKSIINYQDRRTLDKAVLYILDSTMTFLIDKGQVIHPRTLLARNDMITQLKQSNPINAIPSSRRR